MAMPNPAFTARTPHPSCKVYSPGKPKITGLSESQSRGLSKFTARSPGVFHQSARCVPKTLGIPSTLSVSRAASPVVETQDSLIGTKYENHPQGSSGRWSYGITPRDLVRRGSRRRGGKMRVHKSNLCHRMGVLPSRLWVAHQLKVRQAQNTAAWVAKRMAQLRQVIAGGSTASPAQVNQRYAVLKRDHPAMAAIIDREADQRGSSRK